MTPATPFQYSAVYGVVVSLSIYVTSCDDDGHGFFFRSLFAAWMDRTLADIDALARWSFADLKNINF